MTYSMPLGLEDICHSAQPKQTLNTQWSRQFQQLSKKLVLKKSLETEQSDFTLLNIILQYMMY